MRAVEAVAELLALAADVLLCREHLDVLGARRGDDQHTGVENGSHVLGFARADVEGVARPRPCRGGKPAPTWSPGAESFCCHSSAEAGLYQGGHHSGAHDEGPNRLAAPGDEGQHPEHRRGGGQPERTRPWGVPSRDRRSRHSPAPRSPGRATGPSSGATRAAATADSPTPSAISPPASVAKVPKPTSSHPREASSAAAPNQASTRRYLMPRA